MKIYRLLAALLLLLPFSHAAKADLCMNSTTGAWETCGSGSSLGVLGQVAGHTVVGNTGSGTAAPSALTTIPFGTGGCVTNITDPVDVGAGLVCSYSAMTASGTQQSATRWAPYFYSYTDTFNALPNVSLNVDAMFYANMNLGTGFQGNRNLWSMTMALNGTANNITDTSNHGYVTAQIYNRNNGFSAGGIDLNTADASGNFWGMDISNIQQSGSTNVAFVTGLELDMNKNTGSTALRACNLCIYSSANNDVRAVLSDDAILVGRGLGAAVGFGNFIQLGHTGSVFPLDTDSNIIKITAQRNVSSYTAPHFNYGLDWRQGVPTSGFTAFLNAGTDASGNVYGGNLYTAGSVIAETGTVASIAPAAFGGVTGGAYFAVAAFPTISIQAPPNSGTTALATVATMKLTKAILVTGTDVGCTNGDVLTLTGGTGTQATITLTVVAGAATAVSITTQGSYTAKSATPGTTGGTCSVQPTFYLGYGIATVTVTNAGTGYPLYPLPVINLTGSGVVNANNRNTSGELVPTMSNTVIPLVIPPATGVKGTILADSPSAGSIGEMYSMNCPAPTTATITITVTGAPGTVSWPSHPFTAVGAANWTCPINFSNSGGALPAGLVAGTTYYIVGASLSADTFQISDTPGHALAATNKVSITDAGTGTQSGFMGSFLTTGNPFAGAGMSLVAGDWDCSGTSEFGNVSSVTATDWISAVNTAVSLALPYTQVRYVSGSIGANNFDLSSPVYQENVSATTTVYLVDQAAFSGGSQNGGGFLRCRRMR